MSEGMFPQHPKSGDWETLKGRMLAPHELPYSVQDTNYNDGRVDSNGMSPVTTPFEHGLVESGQFNPDNLTHGTDKHMPK